MPLITVTRTIGSSMLRAAFLVCMLSLAVPAQSLAPRKDPMGSITHVNKLATEGILAFRHGDPTFESALKKLFNPDDIPKLEKLIPYAVLVRNNTSSYLMAITVLYSYPSPVYPGKSATNRVSPSARSNDKSQMIEPGGYMFFTPIGDIVGYLDPSMSPQTHPTLTESTVKYLENKLEFYRAWQVTVSVDSIVTDQGILVGPDEGGYEHTMAARSAARAEVYQQAETLTGEELKKYLTMLSALEVDLSHPHNYYLRSTADILLTEMESEGEHALKQSLKHYVERLRLLPAITRKTQ